MKDKYEKLPKYIVIGILATLVLLAVIGNLL